MFRSSLARNLTFVGDNGGDDDSIESPSDKTNSSISSRTTSSNVVFRREKFTYVTGRDILSPTENNDVNSNSRAIRRRKPTPDGYLHVQDVKTSKSDKKDAKFEAPPRIALDRGNHYQVNRDIPSLTEEDLLCDGLRFVGYDETGIKQVKAEENVERFKSFYGVAPSAILPFIKDLKEAHPEIVYRDVMMTCNFLKSDPLKRCMEPVWGRNKTYIGRTVRKYCKMFASLKYLKIKMEFDENDIDTIVYTVDGVNFATSEFRKDPSTKWFDHKSHNR